MTNGHTRRDPSRTAWSVGLIVASAVIVHGVDVGTRFFYDDFLWLEYPTHHGWLGDALDPHNGIYRPTLASWFAGMKSLFGVSAVPFHVALLLMLCGVALLLRTLGLRVGLRSSRATLAAVVYAAHATLVVTTMWAATADVPIAVGAALVTIWLTLGAPSLRRELLAAGVFVLAVMTREFTLVTPALACLLLVAVEGLNWRSTVQALRRARLLWVVAAAVFVGRLALGDGSRSGPYAVRFFGSHVPRNTLTLMSDASHFGVNTATPIVRLWNVVFWLGLAAGAVWAARRGKYLPLAGLLWFFISLVPFLTLISHPMATYYLALPLAGVALSVGGLLDLVEWRVPTLAIATAVFLVVQVFAVTAFRNSSSFTFYIDRTEVLTAMAPSLQEHNNEIVVVTDCSRDQDVSRDGDLFRVVRNEPQLKVRFEVTNSGTC